MPQYEFTVSLKVVHPKMKVEYISEYLSMNPDAQYDVGSERVSKAGRPLGGTYECTLWNKDLCHGNKLDAEETLFEEFVKEQNLVLAKYRDFFKEVCETGGCVEYFVGWFSSGSINMSIVFDPELMQSTSELNISIVLCAYPDNE